MTQNKWNWQENTCQFHLCPRLQLWFSQSKQCFPRWLNILSKNLSVTHLALNRCCLLCIYSIILTLRKNTVCGLFVFLVPKYLTWKNTYTSATTGVVPMQKGRSHLAMCVVVTVYHVMFFIITPGKKILNLEGLLRHLVVQIRNACNYIFYFNLRKYLFRVRFKSLNV